MIYKYNIINESILFNQKDIYYNKDKFDSGEINICFIIGHSGSGKSTMSRSMAANASDKNIQDYCLDDVIANYHFNDNELKEYGDLIYSFFKGSGKAFRYTSKKKWDDDPTWDNREFYNCYEALITKEFIKYSISYAKHHKDKKFIIEGVFIFFFFEPDYFDDYAFFIKGTSLLISKIRAAKRHAMHQNTNKSQVFLKDLIIKNWDYYSGDEKRIRKFYQYFERKAR